MSRYNQPSSLESLALRVVIRYMKKLSAYLLKDENQTVQYYEKKEKSRWRKILHRIRKSNKLEIGQLVITSSDRHSEASQLCQCLRSLLHSMITPPLANEVTSTLLEMLGKLIDDNRTLIDRSWAKGVLKELVDTAIHPAVTHIHITHDLYYLTPMICNRLISLMRLESLEIMFLSDISDLRMLSGIIDPRTEHLIVRSVLRLSDLKTFRFTCNCTDSIVIAVAEACPQLQRLDFKCSRVTDIVIPHIAGLSHLVELNILRSSISPAGCTSLLNCLADNDVCLKSFGCSSISLEALEVLVFRFPKLVSLQLVNYGYYLTPLYQLSNLQIIKLQSGHFYHFRQVLVKIGHQLKRLEFARIVGVEVKLIGEKCPHLEGLVMRYCNSTVLEDTPVPLAGLMNLSSISLQTKYDYALLVYALSQSLKAMQVSIVSRSGFSDECLRNILMRNQLIHLEDLSLECPGRQLTHSVLLTLLDQCSQLVHVRGVSTWGYDEDQYLTLKEEVTCSYPGVSVH